MAPTLQSNLFHTLTQGLMDVGLLGPFNKIVNAPGQAETDFKRWLGFTPGAAAAAVYSIQPEHVKFEPW